MNALNKIGLIPFFISIYFLAYAILPGVMGAESASLVKTVLLLFILFLLLFKSKIRNNYTEYINILMTCFFSYFIINVIKGGNSDIIRWVINITIFFVSYKCCDYKCFFALKHVIKIVTLICTINTLYVSFKNGMIYARYEALVDKCFLTALYGMSYFFCILDIFYNKQKKINILCIFVFIMVNIFLVQSKTSLLALVVELIVLYVFFQEIRPVYNRYIKYFTIISFSFFLILPYLPNIQVSDDLAYGINRIVGYEIFDESSFVRSSDKISMTFDVRDGLRDYCFKLFLDNPVFGIGQGNFKIINKTTEFYWLSETESSWLQILTEGGTFYLCAMLFFFLKPINDTYRKIKTNTYSQYSYYYLMSLSFFLTFFVLYLYNDFADSFFWLSAGIMTSLIVCDKTESLLINNNK